MDLATMLGGLTGADLSDPKVLLGAVVVMIIVGGLIPRWVHQSMMKLKDETISDLRQQNSELLAQNAKLITAAEIGVHIAEDLHRVAQEQAQQDGGD